MFFDVTNQSSTDVYLVTSGHSCTAYAIRAASDATDLVLAGLDDGDCPCGTACEGETQSSIEPLAPGATLMLTWDARADEYRWLKVPDPCDPSGTGTVSDLVLTPRRVGPGTYSVTIGYFLPPACDPCGTSPTSEDTFAPECPADGHATTEFELPTQGDLRVPIDIIEPLPAGGA